MRGFRFPLYSTVGIEEEQSTRDGVFLHMYELKCAALEIEKRGTP